MIITRYKFKQIWAKKMKPFQIFVIRAVIGLVAAVFLTRWFYGRIEPMYIVVLAAILVGLAYFSEYLRKRRSK
jgi:Flp pilus assembly protein TadB